ncbi:MAG: methionyl-tRNA formyltransferase [Pirellulaceae bacterium]|jgi:methionyl-tRNA formyltransferase
MRILMMGTGPFAVPTFESLLKSEHEVVALITRPTPPARGRSKAPPNPMRDSGEKHSIEIYAPDDVNQPAAHEKILAWKPELLVVCDYGQILSRDTLALTKYGGVNLHGSILPKYRGAAPINWALYNGESETGITVIHMTPGLDAGPCLTKDTTKIADSDDAITLEDRLSKMGVESVLSAIDLLSDWDGESEIGTLQDKTAATKAPRLKRNDGDVDWTKSTLQLFNQVRAFKPWPGTYTNWLRSSAEPIRIILEQVRPETIDAITDPETTALQPGQVALSDGKEVWIRTGDGYLALTHIKPAGKRVMEVAEYVRGQKVRQGDFFGTTPS